MKFGCFEAENDFCDFLFPGLVVAVGGEVGVGAVCVSCWICGRWPWGSGVVRIVVGIAILNVGAPRDQKNENMRFLSFVSEAAVFRTRER